jgi:antirestriction protein ArdC
VGKVDAYQVINDHLVSMIENCGELPWQRPWAMAYGKQQQGFDGHIYRGSNWLITEITAQAREYTDPRWLTEKKIKELGGELIDGAKPTPICWWYKRNYTKEDDDGEEQLKSYLTLKVWHVYNVAQVTGVDIEPFPEPEDLTHAWALEDHEKVAKIGEIVRAMPNRPTVEFGGDRAYYMPSSDVVRIPEKERFENPEEWATALTHELGHSTGHKSRLKRKGITDLLLNPFGSEAYSKEELIAELTAAYVCGTAGIVTQGAYRNSAAYLKSWLKALKDDPKMLIMASAQAQKAADYILGRYEKRAKV